MAMTDEEKWQYVEEALRELQERMFEGIEESETEMAEGDDLGKAEGKMFTRNAKEPRKKG